MPQRKSLICFTLIFTLLQLLFLTIHQTNASTETPKETPTEAPTIIFDQTTLEEIGTDFKFTYPSENQALIYEWILFKDYYEVYRKEFSPENFVDYTMNEPGMYQLVVTIQDETGMKSSVLSKEFNIYRPISITSVLIDSEGMQPVSTPLNFSVLAEGDELVYHWYIYKDSKQVYDGLLSQNPSIAYTPIEAGVYQGIVYVKDRFGNYIKEYSKELMIYDDAYLKKIDLETMVNKNDHHSVSNYFIWVDTTGNYVNIFEGENKNWNLIRSMLCTDGKASTPTIKGLFTVKGRGLWLTSYTSKVKAKYKVRFHEDYYFHSILFDMKGEKVVDSRLGESRSHGCIRLSVEDALWIYEHINDGTSVYIE